LASTTADKKYKQFVILLNKRARMATIISVRNAGLKRVDYSVWGVLQEYMYRTIFSLDELKQQLQQ